MPDLPAAVLLDLDDTILADSVNAPHCWREGCELFAPEVPGADAGSLLAAIDSARHWYWSDPERHRHGRQNMTASWQAIVTLALENIGAPSPALAERIALDHAARRQAAMHVLPGALDTLAGLRRGRARLALLTNGAAAAQRAKIERFGLEPYFDCILVEGEFGVGKPDARVFRHALQQLGVSPTDAWMVGDNLKWDVAGPQRAGILGIWVDSRGRGLPADSPVRPDRIIRALPELMTA